MSASAGSARTVLLIVSVTALAALAALGSSLRGMQEVAFPHDEHEGLFPLCAGCHEGVPLGDLADYYPETGSCEGCHDGVARDRVSWDGPSRPVENVEYDHAQHAVDLVEAGDAAQECASCHVPPGGERMAVSDSVQLGTCFTCHAHEADEHQVDAACESCHVPLAASGFGLSAVAALPVPPDHEPVAFAGREHGLLADQTPDRCATCHTRERCVSCHVDTDRDAIQMLPLAPPDMQLPPPVAHYNEPATHIVDGFFSDHGAMASRAECATCHTSEDCTACHVVPAPAPIGSFPSRAQVEAPGVRLSARAPDSHDSFFFMEAHPGLAAADVGNCATCHVESYCVACHDGPVGGGYHPADFVSRHSADAFSRDTECANCHSTAVFCRECHQEAGLVGAGRLGPGYHEGGPLWLLRHGQPARQNLETCASCHKQLDCTQCHGVLGAFKVSPHGPDFDAERAWARSPRACLGCHVRNPLTGG